MSSSNRASSDKGGGGTTPKKKKPLQHLLAGGAAGLVESSVCHPLDTVKTRMQLRRQTALKGRALGSLRDAGGRALGSLRDVGGVLHRATGGSGAAAKGEAARVQPDLSKAKSNAKTTTMTTRAQHSAVVHDVGWERRLPAGPAPSAAAAGTTVPKATSTAATRGAPAVVVAPLGPLGTARRIVRREGFTALYKGLTAVYTGIVPKMAVRFVSFEHYRDVLGGWHGRYHAERDSRGAAGSVGALASPPPPPAVTFAAGLLSGLTEAVLVVTPAEVCKIRMQGQYHSLMDPSRARRVKYRNVVQTATLVAREEGLGALYKGVVPTMLRQGCNQAVNFTAYNWSKRRLLEYERGKAGQGEVSGAGEEVRLEHWQSLLLGGLSGGMGPLANNPLDVVKTRMQKQVIHPGKEPKYKSLLQSCVVIAREEGTPALWKGITPRLMRIMPGQAITFMTYEAVTARMERYGLFD